MERALKERKKVQIVYVSALLSHSDEVLILFNSKKHRVFIKVILALNCCKMHFMESACLACPWHGMWTGSRETLFTSHSLKFLVFALHLRRCALLSNEAGLDNGRSVGPPASFGWTFTGRLFFASRWAVVLSTGLTRGRTLSSSPGSRSSSQTTRLAVLQTGGNLIVVAMMRLTSG